jgi:hypothetical protein
MILIEAGITTLKEIYEKEIIEANPIDTIFLSIYNGEINDNSVGCDFPSLISISKIFKLKMKSKPFDTKTG